MIKFKYCGFTFNCLEHMSEIKETFNGEWFKRFYNKKQFFNYYLGKMRLRAWGNPSESCTPLSIQDATDNRWFNYGDKAVGIWFNEYVDGGLAIIKLQDVTTDPYFLQLLEGDIRDGSGESFFVKDDDGEIFLVETSNG